MYKPAKTKIISLLFTLVLLYAFQQNSMASTVTLNQNKIFVDGQQFNIKGINYNPIPIGSDQLDPTAPAHDLHKIAQTGANTIGTYNLGKFEWAQWSNLTNGENFYNALYPVAEQNNLKIIVAYFSNSTIDWTNSSRVSVVTSQYQALVQKAKDRPSTLMYLIGNEIFEKLPNDTQRTAYAKWIGAMVDWTHSVDPNHPVSYAGDANNTGLTLLKTYAPNMDFYSANNYEWGDSIELATELNQINAIWPQKAVLLHEFGADSLNVPTWSENENMQATRIKELIDIINGVYANTNYKLLGSVLFEYSDQWDKVGSSSTQDKDNGWPWLCHTCFDLKANEDFWGIARSVGTNGANGRVLKNAYYALQEKWTGSTPSPTPTPTLTPTPTPTPTLAGDLIKPQVSITDPTNGSTVANKSTFTIKANASDNVAVSYVSFYIDNILKCNDTTAPYTCAWKVGKNSGVNYLIEARAFDANNNYDSDFVNVTSR